MEQVLGIVIGQVIGTGIAFLLFSGSIARTIDKAVKNGFGKTTENRMAKKYELPPDWEKTCDGQQCICMAHGAWDCVCDSVDWTPREVYGLRLEVNSLLELKGE